MGGVGGEGSIAGSLILVLYRVLQTVRSEQSSLLRLDMTVLLLHPPTGEVLGLLEVDVILLVLKGSVRPEAQELPAPEVTLSWNDKGELTVGQC